MTVDFYLPNISWIGWLCNVCPAPPAIIELSDPCLCWDPSKTNEVIWSQRSTINSRHGKAKTVLLNPPSLVRGSWCPLTGTWDWPSKIAGNWDCFPKISWDFGIGQNSLIFGWDYKNSSNWELGFWLIISWELGLGTPHHDPLVKHWCGWVCQVKDV